MRVAVTGASGKLGTAVVAGAAAAGHSVVAIDTRLPPPMTTPGGQVESVCLDVREYRDLRAALDGADALVHLAAIPSPRQHPPEVVHNLNVVASYNALLAAHDTGIRRVCQASSINATGAAFSRSPRYDYFPLDERHPTYNEDPYSLSKWICEAQADSIARLDDCMSIASLRLHGLFLNRQTAIEHQAARSDSAWRDLWGYTTMAAAVRACLATFAVSPPPWRGHEVFYIVAPRTAIDRPSSELISQYYPSVSHAALLESHQGFYDCTKAETLLGWSHDS